MNTPPLYIVQANGRDHNGEVLFAGHSYDAAAKRFVEETLKANPLDHDLNAELHAIVYADAQKLSAQDFIEKYNGNAWIDWVNFTTLREVTDGGEWVPA